MSSPDGHSVERQLPLLGHADAPIPCVTARSGGPLRARAGRDRVMVDLRDVGPCVRRAADLQQVSAAALIRQAVLSAYGGQEDRQGHPRDQTQAQPGDKIVKITVRVRSRHAAALAARARAADMAQGDFLGSLLDGIPPAPLAPDHEAAIKALMASTDRLAAMSTDLNAFMQFVGRVPVATLEPLRANLGGLISNVRKHLALSAALVAELRPRRRTRR